MEGVSVTTTASYRAYIDSQAPSISQTISAEASEALDPAITPKLNRITSHNKKNEIEANNIYPIRPMFNGLKSVLCLLLLALSFSLPT